MPWRRRKGGYTTRRGGHIVKPAMYERLRTKGLSKTVAAKITNAKRRRRKR